MKPEDLERLRGRSVAKLDDEAALNHVAELVDASADAGFVRGADRALHLLDEIERRPLRPGDAALAEYFRANAWAVKEEAVAGRRSWAWEQPERQEQILALSRAAAHPGFDGLGDVRRCQILTNRANLLNQVGRFTDAIEWWDAALRTMPGFAMARANRGYGLKHYAGMLEDDRERAILLLHARNALASATAPDALFDFDDRALAERFRRDAAAFAAAGDMDRIRAMQDLDAPSMGRGRREREYRRWCLEHRLFLNPLNDLGPHGRAASDNLVLPPIRESLDDRPDGHLPPPVIGFFNQMKQEFVSARYTLFEGLHDTRVHFSDRGVLLFDTLDYPAHSLAGERVRTAFRLAYSLLDKVAFLIDHHWRLGKVADRVNFRNVWMMEGRARLLDRFREHPNWPLRGLFWLSKELFDPQLKSTTAADARQLHDIRNALEHRFLKVQEGWAMPFSSRPIATDGLSLAVDSDLLEAKALRMMRMARSALIQLALAIGVEERLRADAGPDVLVGSMPLHGLDDRRKRRDPL